ncbi:MAG: DnaJ domain-containing protein [Deltaproteobacteria bacterium]|nr:DnaJ domain-containing protein [Deltaproteobacteria bacterium]
MNPYEVLGIDREADDATIRKAYLELVKRYPPERFPEKFRQIAGAYDQVKDKKSRLEYYLFSREMDCKSPFEIILKRFSMTEKRRPMTFDEIKEYLRKSYLLDSDLS